MCVLGDSDQRSTGRLIPVKDLSLLLCRPSHLFDYLTLIQSLNPASPLFKNEAFLLGDVVEKFSPAPAHVGSPAPQNLRRFATDSATSPVQVSRLQPGVFELTSQTLREPPRDIFAKGSRAESNPRSSDTGRNDKVQM